MRELNLGTSKKPSKEPSHRNTALTPKQDDIFKGSQNAEMNEATQVVLKER